MGLDYSYDLFFERAQLWDVLQAVSGLARIQPERQTIIVFPDHELVLPFGEYSERNSRIAFDDPMRRRHFSGSMYFEVDEAIQQYVEEWQAGVREDRGVLDWKPPFDEQGRVAIGDISLLIWSDLNANSRKDYDPNLVELIFIAATTRMSLLFEESQSIRKTFVQLLESNSGVYGLLNRDDDAVMIWLRGQLMSKVIPDPHLPLHEIERSLQERDE